MRGVFAVWLGSLLALAGCGTGGRVRGGADARVPDAHAAASTTPPAREPEVAARAPPPRSPLARDLVIEVPAGVVRVGSRPDTEGRVPRTEADLAAVALPAFRIDRLPYPNDPAEAPRTRVTRDEASALCATEGKRLCTELEWERACKGDDVADYPTDGAYDVEACSLDPISCASPLDVLSLGITAFEWTASDVSRGLGSERYSAVARGGRPADPITDHRCGARHALDPSVAENATTFRCCQGDISDAAYPDEPSRRAFAERELDVTELRTMLAGVPELSRFAEHFRTFSPEEIDRALARGGVDRANVSWQLTSGLLVWSPEPGEEAWVLAGTDETSSLVAVLHPLADGTPVHGTSFVLEDEPVPIALAWDWGQRRTIQWSTSWGTAGEGGVIEHRDDHRIVIVQR